MTARKLVTKATSNARTRGRRDWRRPFLEALAREGTVKQACVVAGVSRQHAYRERQSNEEFAVAWHDVEESLTDGLERKAVELALAGDTKMLEFLLKARRPEKYRERYDVHHSGRVDVTPEKLRQMSDEELADLERRLAS